MSTFLWRIMCTALALLAWPFVAFAQIYGDTSSDGVVTLSNFGSDEARTVIVAAPLEPVKPVVSVVSPVGVAVKPQDSRVLPEALRLHIQEASAAYKVPAALIQAVIAVESNYNTQALSHKGAQGLMQLMPATAKRFGGTNAFDARDNILTGSRYLRWLLDTFNHDIALAVAAYNAGENAVIRAGNRIPPYSETQKYVPKVLARYEQAGKAKV